MSTYVTLTKLFLIIKSIYLRLFIHTPTNILVYLYVKLKIDKSKYIKYIIFI